MKFMAKNIYLVSLGCDKNRVDGEVMIGKLRQAGFTVANDPDAAQVIIVNTCGFIRDAVQESIDLVLELAEYKKQGKCEALVIVGCMSERYRDEIKESIPESDAILGVGQHDLLVQEVGRLIGLPENGEVFAFLTDSDPYLARLAARTDDAIPHVAYVKISEGCDNHCTYCTIPAIRGAYTSRTMENILEECRLLIDMGARELVLVAQDTALYGMDIYGEKRLPQLMREIAKLSEEIWIRIMYAYPEHITPELIDAIAGTSQICKYIDMPIQHSEDSVLSQMGRASTRKDLLSLIATFREKIPGIAIRTTLMVGFPGETAENFRNMYEFVREVKFDRLGVFPYSREEGTPAATFPKQVRAEVKQARLARIMTLQQKIHFEKQKQYVGKTLPVIVDSIPYTGRTQWDAFEVDAVVKFTSSASLTPGEIYPVLITSTDQYDLRGMCKT